MSGIISGNFSTKEPFLFKNESQDDSPNQNRKGHSKCMLHTFWMVQHGSLASNNQPHQK